MIHKDMIQKILGFARYDSPDMIQDSLQEYVPKHYKYYNNLDNIEQYYPRKY